ncbi:hypothetical protein SCLCIDRAFT_115015 [Scleroderma citrinum Foug A]|uniref:Retrotransposon gag domain-containing protein n=1 Tax=Scleroderma citrinum Foug A TaxID=1036808 RepID=A0A0C3AHY1_9AGAM|nr:hypothetical protein SCLCIDRAFT_115015 [Scleroderma citrinum Foug A]
MANWDDIILQLTNGQQALHNTLQQYITTQAAGGAAQFKKIVPAPKLYDGSPQKFHEWWSKTKVWVATTVKTRSPQNFFLLGNNQEWARSQLLCLRQGPRQRIDNFLAQFQALKVQSACPNEYAKDLLERAVQRKVLEQVYMRGLPREMWEQVVGAVCTVERAQELFLINTSTPTRYFSTNNYTTSSGTPSGSGAPMDIGAANTRPQRGKGIQCSFLHNLFRALRDFVPNMLADEAGRARALRIMGRIFGRILVGFVIIRKGSLGTKGLPINQRKR